MPPAVAALNSQGGKESAVDDEVGAGDVGCSVAGQQYDEVGHLFGAVHPPRHRISGGLIGDILGVAAAGAGNCRGDAVLAEPQLGGDRPWTDCVDGGTWSRQEES